MQQSLLRNEVTGGWRLSFQVRRGKGKRLELHTFLQTRKRLSLTPGGINSIREQPAGKLSSIVAKRRFSTVVQNPLLSCRKNSPLECSRASALTPIVLCFHCLLLLGTAVAALFRANWQA